MLDCTRKVVIIDHIKRSTKTSMPSYYFKLTSYVQLFKAENSHIWSLFLSILQSQFLLKKNLLLQNLSQVHLWRENIIWQWYFHIIHQYTFWQMLYYMEFQMISPNMVFQILNRKTPLSLPPLTSLLTFNSSLSGIWFASLKLWILSTLACFDQRM